MDYELDFDTSLLDYHALPSKVDDLPYLDLFHDDKLDFGEDRQDCADLVDAASPNDVIGGLFDQMNSSPEAEEEGDGKDPEQDQSEEEIVKVDSKDNKNKNSGSRSASCKDKVDKKNASKEKESAEPETKRPRRSARQYNLRQTSIINRIETETRRAKPRQPKPKSKPPPLSKYRRRTANGRERTRMAEINDAFEVLRQAIPDYPVEESSKLTKITTLRLALNYIGALREMLGYSESSPSPPLPPPPPPPTVTSASSPSTATATKTSTPTSADDKATLKNTRSVNVSCHSSAVTLTKGCESAYPSADPVLPIVNTDPFSEFNLAAISFQSTVPSPGSVSTIPSPGNLSCINTNMNCLSPGLSQGLSPGTMHCLSPDSMSCVSPSMSLTCSSPGSSISEGANYYGLPYMGLSNPLDSEGESVTSMS